MINVNKYIEIVEKFSHHIMGKINVSNLLIELNYSPKELIQNNEEMVWLISLFKEIFVNKNTSTDYTNKIKNLFSLKETIVIINDYNNYLEYKNILLFLLYEVSHGDVKIVVNDNNIIYENLKDEKNISENMIKIIENKIKNEWNNISSQLDKVFQNYIIIDNKIIFKFQE
jgi:hypothetical protein